MGDDVPCRVAAGTSPVFETLPYASLVSVMQSCQQERDPGRVREGSSCKGPPQEARKVSWERRGWWGRNGPGGGGSPGMGPTQVFLEL